MAELLAGFSELLRLAHEQTEALTRGELDWFGSLHERRASIITRMGVGDELREQVLTDRFMNAPLAARQALVATLAELGDVDRLNQDKLAGDLAAMQGELPAIDAARRAASAYRGAQPNAAYVDRAS
ncbi:MAG: hypothetical protein U0360_02740 [Dehalococcoidia bacterium]